MKRIRSKKLWAGTLAATAAAGLGLTLVTTAPADTERRGSPKTIRMVLTQGPLFKGPDTIAPGQNLRILNRTKVRDIGSHFFSIFTKDSLPETNQEIRACARIEFAPCENVAKAHNVSRTFNVRRRNVDRGANGWDSAFTSESQGDSWFTDEKRESETRTISAEPGSTLYYFCVIHPQTMTGSIQVTD